MKEDILNYLMRFNELAQVKVQFAILEPLYTPKGTIVYNLYITVSPTFESVVHSALEEISVVGSFEKVASTPVETEFIFRGFPLKEGKVFDLPSISSLEGIQFVSISNLTRFYNFKLDNPKDPFLNMFLNSDNILYITPEFKTSFLDKKEDFKPSSLCMLNSVKEALSKLLNQSTEYSSYHDSTKLNKLLMDLHVLIRLYFIAIKYHSSGELKASIEEKYTLILSTLSQAYRPWEFVLECINNICELQRPHVIEEGYTLLSSGADQKIILRKECVSFLTQQLIGDIKHAS